MSIEELKRHFRKATHIKCLMDGQVYDVVDRVTDVHFDGTNFYWIDVHPDKQGKALNSVLVYSVKEKQLAEIIDNEHKEITVT